MVARVVALALLIMGMSQGQPVVWTKPGEIRIVVVERDGKPIPGVAVELLTRAQGAARRAVIGDTKGRVAFGGVSAGDNILTFQLSGFAPCSIGPITMRADERGSPELPEFVLMMKTLKWS